MRVSFVAALPMTLGLVLALALMPGCKKRFDGTCKVDADCLEIQKCASGVCVRAKPIFEAYVPPPAPGPVPRKVKPKSPIVMPPPADEPPPAGDQPAAKPKRPELGPAVPRQKDPSLGRRFRLDA